MDNSTTNLTIGALRDELKAAKVREKESRTVRCDDELSAITSDSRAVTPGGVFIAVRGTAADGHAFIPQAVKAGAALIVCEELPENPDEGISWLAVDDTAKALGVIASAWHGHPSRRLTLVGVTGTNGKTTIATLLYELARIRGHRAGLLSTVVNKIDEEEVKSTHTTPDPISLNRLLARMVEAGCTFAAMEVSSHAADQKRIAGLDFNGGIFTNLTRDHLDYHVTFANYLKAKQSFFDGLKREAFALTNIDDRNGEIVIQNTAARRKTYSIMREADFRCRVIENRLDGMLLAFNGQEVEMMFAGRFNASNLTAVYGAACLLGWNDERLLADMSALTPVSGRFEPVAGPGGIIAIVDYAHTPDALANVLDTINEIRLPSQKVITVCGCGGDRDRGKRPVMAKEAASRSWKVILTSDNPRSENPDEIIAEMRGGLSTESARRTLSLTDRREAIRLATQLASQGDIILIAGKGHETYQIIGDRTLHFDDREEARKAFQELSTDEPK